MHVGVGRKIAARNVDAERQASLHQAGVGGVAIDRQGDGVANLDVAAHRAGHRNRPASLRRVDDVVGRDGVEGNARHRRQRVHYLHRQGSRVFGVTAASKATPAATPTARMPWKSAIGVTASV
jgi:hypothetical protein